MNLHNMPGFRSLWSAHTIALVGTNTGLIVIPLLALNVTQASVFQMGLLGAAESLAVLLFGIYIGWFVDWLGGRNSMILANVLRAVALSTIPVAYFLGYLTFVQVFIVVFIIGVGTLLYEGAVSSSVVSEFPRSEWSKINSAMEGSSAVTEVAGPGVGGLLVQVIGAPFSVLTDVVMYLFSGVICFFRKDPPKATETTGEAAANEGEEAESRAAVLAGVRFVWRTPVLRAIVLSAAHFNFFTAGFTGIITYFMVRDLGFSSLLVGFTSVASGILGVAATMVAHRLMTTVSTAKLYALSYLLPGLFAFAT